MTRLDPAPIGLVLASASPRRIELLSQQGWDFEVRPADIDESYRSGESPVAYVRRLAAAKACAVDGEVVLAADTTVDVDGVVLAKPDDAKGAAAMLGLLAGRGHLVHTAVAVRRGPVIRVAHCTTDVWFAPLDLDTIERYVATGEPLDKAGAYAIQGLGGWLVERVAGSVSNVIGLPLHLVRAMLRDRWP